jgi:hypothetical protein
MSLSLSSPRLLTYSGSLLSLSRSALHLVLSSLSRSPSATALATTPCRGSAPTMRRPGGCSDDHPVSCAAALTTTLRPGDRSGDEEALRWATLERLPTHPAHRQGIPPGLLPRVLAQLPISGAHRPGLFPRLRVRRRAHPMNLPSRWPPSASASTSPPSRGSSTTSTTSEISHPSSTTTFSSWCMGSRAKSSG